MKPIILFALAVILISPLQKAKAQTNTKPAVAVLNHIAIYVADLKQSTNFYHDLFNLEIAPEPFHDGRHTWFHTGGPGQLHVVSGNTEMDKHNINVHLAFSVKSLPDFIAHLKSEKIKFGNWAQTSETPEVRPDGINQIYLQDPDGYWIEVNNDK